MRTPLINMQPGMSFQALGGRIPHQSGPRRESGRSRQRTAIRFVQIMLRSMDSMGLDYQVIFPTAMLHLGMNPMEEIEVEHGPRLLPLADGECPARRPAHHRPAYLPFNIAG